MRKLLSDVTSQHWYSKIFIEKRLERIFDKLENKFLLNYSDHSTSLLNSLCSKYGSDKGGGDNYTVKPFDWPAHNYADFYEILFEFHRHNVKSIVECGIGTNNPDLVSSMGINGKPGASLRVWRDYFPNSMVFGLDIDSDILFSEDRIKTYQCDQTSPSSIANFINNSNLAKGSVDIIIDDGLHEFAAGRCFFENMIEILSHEGIYIIEDVGFADIEKYVRYFEQKRDQYRVRYVTGYTSRWGAGSANKLIVVKKI